MYVHNNVNLALINGDLFMLLTNLLLVTLCDPDPVAMISDAVIAIQGEEIRWIGDANLLPREFSDMESVDLGGRLVTPGLIDCHSHIVFGGNRAREFEMRLNGATYAEIARAGGGILSTVTATRATDLDGLLAEALPRIDALIAEGVTMIEVKSGYGLDRETELNMLRAARMIAQVRPIRVRTSFLGAHAIPAEMKHDPDGYIDEVCIPTLRAAHAEGLVDAVDGFCEGIAFTVAQIERLFKVARELGLPVKLHAEQLSHSGGSQLAARYGAQSVDHLEYATIQDAKAMATSGAVAVILPGAFYTLHEVTPPPIGAFRAQNVPMALATDCNPGSSPMASLLLAMNMGCTLFGMTPAETLSGVTRHAAKALGVVDAGQIRVGLRADLAIWDIENPAELAYRIGFNPLYARVFGGVLRRKLSGERQ